MSNGSRVSVLKFEILSLQFFYFSFLTLAFFFSLFHPILHVFFMSIFCFSPFTNHIVS